MLTIYNKPLTLRLNIYVDVCVIQEFVTTTTTATLCWTYYLMYSIRIGSVMLEVLADD